MFIVGYFCWRRYFLHVVYAAFKIMCKNKSLLKLLFLLLWMFSEAQVVQSGKSSCWELTSSCLGDEIWGRGEGGHMYMWYCLHLHFRAGGAFSRGGVLCLTSYTWLSHKQAALLEHLCLCWAGRWVINHGFICFCDTNLHAHPVQQAPQLQRSAPDLLLKCIHQVVLIIDEPIPIFKLIWLQKKTLFVW